MNVPAQTASAASGLVPYKTSLGTLLGFVESQGVRALSRIRRLKRAVWASGQLHGIADAGMRPPVVWFVTLTYRGVNDSRPDHIGSAIQRFRNWCKARKVACRYTWVAELQGRGAVHYHLLAWLPHGLVMPKWDLPRPRGRAPWWPHGMSNRQEAYSGVGYLMKYLSKLGEFHRFPKGLRLYGIGGLDVQGRNMRSWYNLPQWCKNQYGVGEIKRGTHGHMVRETGEILSSPYRVERVPGGLLLRLVGELRSRFPASIGFVNAYSSVDFA